MVRSLESTLKTRVPIPPEPKTLQQLELGSYPAMSNCRHRRGAEGRRIRARERLRRHRQVPRPDAGGVEDGVRDRRSHRTASGFAGAQVGLARPVQQHGVDLGDVVKAQHREKLVLLKLEIPSHSFETDFATASGPWKGAREEASP